MSTIILLDHHDNLGDDVATQYLAELGFNLDVRRPVNGDPLPELTDDIIGTVVYGGSMNVTERDELPYLKDEIQWIRRCIREQKKVLGICLGGQLIAHSLGANVSERENGLCEFGYYEIKPTPAGKGWIPDSFYVVEAHYQEFDIPQGAVHLARGEVFENQAFKYGDNVIGLQFHPEITEAIFTRWQNSDWAFFHSPGAQTLEDQNALKSKVSETQETWFRHLLKDFFCH